ncbi:MAG: hypothetical protein OXC41_07600, partial [Gammaproteobacteria bacterium]|nr:hypothetical protein [Gammaproteobacteria bacterium]
VFVALDSTGTLYGDPVVSMEVGSTSLLAIRSNEDAMCIHVLPMVRIEPWPLPPLGSSSPNAGSNRFGSLPIALHLLPTGRWHCTSGIAPSIATNLVGGLDLGPMGTNAWMVVNQTTDIHGPYRCLEGTFWHAVRR